MREIIKTSPVIAIFRHVPLDKTIPYAKAVLDGGVTAFEVALNSECALKQIELLKREYANKAFIGAGTANTTDKATEAIQAGADFLLSPSADEEVLFYCEQHQIKLLPGVMTPSDVSRCLKYKFSLLKLFPAADLPAGYLKSLKGPFDQTDYVAVGGVDHKNAATFFRSGFVGVGVGGGLVPRPCILEGNWEGATESVKKFMQMIEMNSN